MGSLLEIVEAFYHIIDYLNEHLILIEKNCIMR